MPEYSVKPVKGTNPHTVIKGHSYAYACGFRDAMETMHDADFEVKLIQETMPVRKRKKKYTATRQQVIRELKKINALEHSVVGLGDTDICAPTGKVWACNECHFAVTSGEYDTAGEFWNEVMQDINCGLIDCNEYALGKCETCNETD